MTIISRLILHAVAVLGVKAEPLRGRLAGQTEANPPTPSHGEASLEPSARRWLLLP